MREIPQSILAIQNLVIKPEEIRFVVRELAKDQNSSRDGDWFTAMAILVQRYPGDLKRSCCISDRMECAVPLMNDRRMQGIAEEARHTSSSPSQAMFHAVAKCPLRTDGRRVWFDPDEFFAIAEDYAGILATS